MISHTYKKNNKLLVLHKPMTILNIPESIDITSEGKYMIINKTKLIDRLLKLGRVDIIIQDGDGLHLLSGGGRLVFVSNFLLPKFKSCGSLSDQVDFGIHLSHLGLEFIHLQEIFLYFFLWSNNILPSVDVVATRGIISQVGPRKNKIKIHFLFYCCTNNKSSLVKQSSWP